MRTRALAVLAVLISSPVSAEERPTDAYLDQSRDRWTTLARKIWDASETALQEKKSAQALVEVLQKEGFKVTWGVGGEPTAFMATAGAGTPTIALLAEYDALPGLSQKPGATTKSAVVENGAGHGCGHNLLGTAATAAAIAANRERQARKLPGTIQLFGTPAEEVLFGKTFMVRDGAFKTTDAVLAWHPDDQNRVINRARLAAAAAEVEFFGRSSHASAAPWAGRSALDALVLFDHAMALMREHIKPTARIHRVIKEGGEVANVIPDHTRGEYWVRDATGESVQELLGRMRKAADGAAMATETRAQVKILFSVRDVVDNPALDALVQKELERVGPPSYDAQDLAFARSMQKELGLEQAGMAQKVGPYTQKNGQSASSDLAEVSAVVPAAELGVATRPLGTVAHHWAQTSCAAHPVGFKGMVVAAKVLAASAVDLLADPATVAAVKEDFRKATEGKPYLSPLSADAKPQVSR
ncbi:MAG TPA: amidohydrolase [Myxococcaceae bacterium]|nr:amidohydrolase [Myxococcaceae bacterium]